MLRFSWSGVTCTRYQVGSALKQYNGLEWLACFTVCDMQANWSGVWAGWRDEVTKLSKSPAFIQPG